MKNHNKFIPVALLAGLCILAVSLCKEGGNTGSTMIEDSSSSDRDGTTETKIKHKKSKKDDRKHCRRGNCYK